MANIPIRDVRHFLCYFIESSSLYERFRSSRMSLSWNGTPVRCAERAIMRDAIGEVMKTNRIVNKIFPTNCSCMNIKYKKVPTKRVAVPRVVLLPAACSLAYTSGSRLIPNAASKQRRAPASKKMEMIHSVAFK